MSLLRAMEASKEVQHHTPMHDSTAMLFLNQIHFGMEMGTGLLRTSYGVA